MSFRSILLGILALVVAPAGRAATSYPVETTFVGATFNLPVQVVFPPGETKRALIVELGGKIVALPDINSPTRLVVLDLSSRVAIGGADHGMLSMACHPKFAENGFFYVWTSLWETGSRYLRLLRFTVGTNGVAVPSSEQILISQQVGAGGHDGGDLFFGADGYLYLSVGDGDQGDAGAEAVASHQHIDRGFFGGILRIDVDSLPGNLSPNSHLGQSIGGYKIPADNPFVGATTFNNLPVNPAAVRTEFWTIGMRNPFRMSLDSTSGEIWVGDVGLDLREEVDVAIRGGNYGWNFREGTLPGPAAATTPTGAGLISPVWEYSHESGDICITGGVIYRGARFPELHGNYVFADYVSGKIWVATNLSARPLRPVQVSQIATQVGIVNITVQPGTGDILFANLNKGVIQKLGTAPVGSPSIVAQPMSQSVIAGSVLALHVDASGASLGYQWYLNGIAIIGATTSTFYVQGADVANAGNYTCLISNSSGTVLSNAVAVSVQATSDAQRVVNISTRGLVGTGDNIMIAGFVIGGSVSKTVLVRASGPALAPFVASGTLPDPLLKVYDGAGNLIASNQGWNGNTAVTSVAVQVGAFAWTNGTSKDSALLLTLPPGSYSAQVSGASGDTGVVLTEVYDVP